MKKEKLMLFGSLMAVLLFVISCSKEDECHECHIAWTNASGQEVEVEIGEFCGSELEDVESSDYSHALEADVIIGNDTVPAGNYSEIHCEEHHH